MKNLYRDLLGPAEDLVALGALDGSPAQHVGRVLALRAQLGPARRVLAPPGCALEALAIATLPNTSVTALEHTHALETLDRMAEDLAVPISVVPVHCAVDLGAFDYTLEPPPVSPIPPPSRWLQRPALFDSWRWVGQGDDCLVVARDKTVARIARHRVVSRGLSRSHAVTQWLARELGEYISASIELQRADDFAFVFEPFIEGDAVEPDRAPRELGRDLGRFFSRLHGLDPEQAPQEAHVHLRYDRDTLALKTRLISRTAQTRHRQGLPWNASCAQQYPELESRLSTSVDTFMAEPPPAPGPTRFIHADVGPEHVFVLSDRLHKVIDWTNSGVGDPMLDLAYIGVWGGDRLLDAALDVYAPALTARDLERLTFHRRCQAWFAFEEADSREERETTKAGLLAAFRDDRQ